ncbi:Succinate--CoA ligase [ADP-forming] subunit beta, mitochondrial [Aduncisulcus paluster]|uniref:Succinate--CoA ligase [ADP-forming] subunit beta, mitochondrial n=1 Tax=Aduncisulcus paluster TaxID=2918883 RepID=A0ABQ5KJW9_9EUKA|nr:Succinate--CoA ligase [ADP-forming] subunit beta, mitochondrial [Aduncisulcus paluster]|eukprot:gnl/Carplike_NY0171/495_a680_2480.p1 GENE.gnl/Carplike_NY0171/495_a680_2480~~gnl/Carplike_NY0171/495_a680_2480.p1  ORF type:complete len:408 (-),score=164.44 gnl/Carplike_NY0171/495_a680_2480:58-1281(-)
MISTSAVFRSFNIHEYQAKDLLRKFGLKTLVGGVAETADEAEKISRMVVEEGSGKCVIKAQIHAGGRGMGHFKSGFKGGVHLCKTSKEGRYFAEKMLGETLVTKQTGEEGKLVRKVYFEDAAAIKRELYVSILLDRGAGGPVFIVSTEGGMDIEGVAEHTPELIWKFPVGPDGLNRAKAEEIARALKFGEASLDQVCGELTKMYEMFVKTDATQVEINPFAETEAGEGVCLDAKFNFDDGAEFRQKEIFDMRDPEEEDMRELEAAKHGLNYVSLPGTIGCLVNGAGLAMATCDMLSLVGLVPANFLDTSGGINHEKIYTALDLVLSDEHVKVMFVNIFGGIVNCRILAEALVDFMKERKPKTPFVVRLEGTEADAAKKCLKESGVPIFPVNGMHDGVLKVKELHEKL